MAISTARNKGKTTGDMSAIVGLPAQLTWVSPDQKRIACLEAPGPLKRRGV
jgi:hypothetical protein